MLFQNKTKSGLMNNKGVKDKQHLNKYDPINNTPESTIFFLKLYIRRIR